MALVQFLIALRLWDKYDERAVTKLLTINLGF
jgi:hypothetical protein